MFGSPGTHEHLLGEGVEIGHLPKLRDGPQVLNEMQNRNIRMIINIPYSERTSDGAFPIRQLAIRNGILCITNAEAVEALLAGLGQMKESSFEVNTLQSIAPLSGRK